jgi:hypothetical protein
MPRVKRKLIDDAIGTPSTVKRANKAFTKARPAARSSKADEPSPEIIPSDVNIRTKNGVFIPDYPTELHDLAMGDKSPAVVAWYAENHPEAHAALYEGRIVG